jgi:hypothetical protein
MKSSTSCCVSGERDENSAQALSRPSTRALGSVFMAGTIDWVRSPCNGRGGMGKIRKRKQKSVTLVTCRRNLMGEKGPTSRKQCVNLGPSPSCPGALEVIEKRKVGDVGDHQPVLRPGHADVEPTNSLMSIVTRSETMGTLLGC